MTSYYPSIVTVFLYGTVSDITVSRKSPILTYSTYIRSTHWG